MPHRSRMAMTLACATLLGGAYCSFEPVEHCRNGVDDDHDGFTDCDDPDCALECSRARVDGEGEGDGDVGEGEGEGDVGEGEGEGGATCFFDGAIVSDVGGHNGHCDTPFTLDVTAGGRFHAHTTHAQFDGNAPALDACSTTGTTTTRDVALELTLPIDVVTVRVSVDPGNLGGTPIVVLHDGDTCDSAAATCATTNAQCAAIAAIAGVDFTGTTLMLTISEDLATTNDYAVYIEVDRASAGEGEGE